MNRPSNHTKDKREATVDTLLAVPVTRSASLCYIPKGHHSGVRLVYITQTYLTTLLIFPLKAQMMRLTNSYRKTESDILQLATLRKTEGSETAFQSTFFGHQGDLLQAL